MRFTNFAIAIAVYTFGILTVSAQSNVCAGVPAAYNESSQYCQSLCIEVCQVTLCTDTDLQQSLVDSCYEECACETQGLSLGSTFCTGGIPAPGLVFCYTEPGCPPSDGAYFSQGD